MVAIKASGVFTGAAKRAVDGVQLVSGLYVADLSDAIGVASWDFRVGAVSEFTFPAVDRNRELMRRGLLTPGMTLKWDGENWQIAAIERDYRGDDIWLNFTARSRLARRLRNMTGGKKSVEKDTPQAFIGRAVKKAGGTALVEPGAGRMRIVQKPGETVLDVIASIASDTGVEWVEHGNTFYVGTPWWAYKGNTGLPTWNARIDGKPTVFAGLNVLNFSSRSSLDDRNNAAEASMTVEVERGSKVRPWHLVDVTRADDDDNGTWLVSDVTFDEVGGSADLSLQRPLKTSPKKASQGTSTSAAVDTGDFDLGSPIDGSSYKDVARPPSWSGRSVAGILSLYKNNRGGLGHPIYNGCLWYAQEAAGYPHIGANPHVLWVMLSTSKRHTGRSVVPGAVLLYRTSRVGHATVYLGGGRVLGTDMDENGNYSPGKWSIASADACERSFGTLIGWYSP